MLGPEIPLLPPPLHQRSAYQTPQISTSHSTLEAFRSIRRAQTRSIREVDLETMPRNRREVNENQPVDAHTLPVRPPLSTLRVYLTSSF